MGVAGLSPLATNAAANAQNFQGVMSGDSDQDTRQFGSVAAPLQRFSTGGLTTKNKSKTAGPGWRRVLVVHAQPRGVLVAPWWHPGATAAMGKRTRVKTKCCFFSDGAARPAEIQP